MRVRGSGSRLSFRALPSLLSLSACQGWAVNAMQTLVLTFVMEDIATTFELSSVSKGLIGSVNFFGKAKNAGERRGGGRERVTVLFPRHRVCVCLSKINERTPC